MKTQTGFGGTFVSAGMLVKLMPSAGLRTGRRCMVEVLAVSDDGFCDVKLITVGKNSAGWKSENRARVFIAHLEGV